MVSFDKSGTQSDESHQYPDAELLGTHDALLRPAVTAHPVDFANPHGSAALQGDLLDPYAPTAALMDIVPEKPSALTAFGTVTLIVPEVPGGVTYSLTPPYAPTAGYTGCRSASADTDPRT